MKVCFIGSYISNAFEGDIIGGAEKQQMLIQKGIQSEDLEVMVLEYYLNKAKLYDGIQVIPAWYPQDNSFLKKLKRIENQIKTNNAEVIYARATQLYVAFLYLFLKIKGSKVRLLWGVAHDQDLTSKYDYTRVNQAESVYAKLNAKYIFNLSSNLLYLFSDTIICQTKEQVALCKKKWIRKPVVQISNIYVHNFEDNFKLKDNIRANAVWVNKFVGTKGEDILLQIAKDLPEITIICLGHVSKYFTKTKIFQEIEQQKNLILVGRVPHNQVSAYISNVDFILNTSPSEGLSNVFLEGWDQKKPVISYTVNPNEYLTKEEAGYCALNSYEKLISKLHSILKDSELLKRYGENGYNLLNKNHVMEVIIPKYLDLFSRTKI